MIFRQPNDLARVMNQILDQLDSGRVLTLKFANKLEAARGLEVLHELATQRQTGVIVTPLREHIVELRLAQEAA